MKKYLFLLPLLVILLQGCLKDKITKTYSILRPVYKSKTEVYANIKSNAPRDITVPGKIFVLGNYIFLNEVDKGVHVIDNSNPASPVVKTFIDIPGNLDIAVKGNTLYADLYSDLVVVDITNPLQANFVKYIPHVFPERSYGSIFGNDSSQVIVDWIRKDTTVRVRPNGGYMYDAFGSPVLLANSGSVGAAQGSGPVGMAGSMARFAVVNDYLYAVNYNKLSSFNISTPGNPVSTASLQVGWQIETVYPFKNRLFIGSATGMFIYDISNPALPAALGQISHIRSCDPVVADDNYAYVTLRNGTVCAGFTNQLDIVNVTNLLSPTLSKSVPLTNPHGLAKDHHLLFICDGRDGLKLFDATDPVNPVLKTTVSGIDTYDAIAYNNILLVVAKDGLYQYAYTVSGTLTQKSKLAVKK
jgi:hypothetical protein